MRDHFILYDADCGFCRRSLHLILAWDRHGRLQPVALQESRSDQLLGGMDAEKKMNSWHLVAPDGRIWSAGEAVAPLARLLPGGRLLAFLADTFPNATDRTYRWVSHHRSLFGKVVSKD